MLDVSRLEAAPLVRDPFDHVVVPGFLRQAEIAAALADFPEISAPGLFPISALECRGAFARLIDAISQPEVAQAFGDKFGVAVGGRPLMVTVRGRCQPKDGKVHTDSRSKIVTALLYLNADWDEAGGRLRLLRSDDIADVAAEVPPAAGTLVAFRRTDRSYHGHLPFSGVRRYVMFNWLTGEAAAFREVARHRLSATVKNLAAYAMP